MIQNLWETIYNAVWGVMVAVATWLKELWEWAWGVLMLVFAVFEEWITYGWLWITGTVENAAHAFGRVLQDITGFDVAQLTTAWNYMWSGYASAEYFVPITACITILLAGMQAAITVRIARWLIACIPWPTANG